MRMQRNHATTTHACVWGARARSLRCELACLPGPAANARGAVQCRGLMHMLMLPRPGIIQTCKFSRNVYLPRTYSFAASVLSCPCTCVRARRVLLVDVLLPLHACHRATCIDSFVHGRIGCNFISSELSLQNMKHLGIFFKHTLYARKMPLASPFA